MRWGNEKLDPKKIFCCDEGMPLAKRRLYQSSSSKRVSPTNDGEIRFSGLEFWAILRLVCLDSPRFPTTSLEVHFKGSTRVTVIPQDRPPMYRPLKEWDYRKNLFASEGIPSRTSLISVSARNRTSAICTTRRSAICDAIPRGLALEPKGRIHH
jgi:hypothetical protein